jgi:hypothetical protein
MTVQEYMNDPRLLGDPDMKDALEPIKELHAIRLKIQDETSGMSPMKKRPIIRKTWTPCFPARGVLRRNLSIFPGKVSSGLGW